MGVFQCAKNHALGGTKCKSWFCCCFTSFSQGLVSAAAIGLIGIKKKNSCWVLIRQADESVGITSPKSSLGVPEGLEQRIGWEEPSAASDKQGEGGWVPVFGTSWLLVGGFGLSCLVLRYGLDAPAIPGHSN